MRIALSGLVLVLVACAPSGDEEPTVETVQNALTTQTIEAESFTGGNGTNVAVVGTSGGAVKEYVTSSLVFATTTATTTYAVVGARVTLRTVGACSTNPWMAFRVDGVSSSWSITPSATWQDHTLAFSGTSGSHTLEMRLRQDGGGCAVQIDKLAIDQADPPPPPLYLEAEAATGQGSVVSDGSAHDGAYRAFATATYTATASFTLATNRTTSHVRVRASGCASAPWAKVWIDGTAKLTTQLANTGAWENLPLAAAVAAGNHTVTYEYRSGPAGCALQFDYLLLD